MSGHFLRTRAISQKVDEARPPTMMRFIEGHPQESIKGKNHIDSLCDELLTEILIRLPTHKSVIQCMRVCKRWASMASHPCFISKFIALKLVYSYNDGIKLNKEHGITFALQYTPGRMNQGSCRVLTPSILNAQDFYFSCSGDEIASLSARGFASCNDLLLYWKRDNVEYNYSIVNVQTRQRVVLPSLPYHYLEENLAGFICDALFSCDKEIVINFAYHYSVVIVDCTKRPSTKLNAHIFSSHCGSHWCNRVLSLKKACKLQPHGYSSGFCFCFDGKLHFSCFEGFFGFDHNSIKFDDEIQCHLVEWPNGMIFGYQRVYASQENLYLSDYCGDTSTIRFWVLKDYKEGNWLLKHRIETQEWVSCDSWVLKKFNVYSCQRVLGFNPSSSVIYVVVPDCIFLCNLVTKMVEWVCDIPNANRHQHYLEYFYSFPLIYQIMPTPLPRLANSVENGANAMPTSG